MNQTCSASFRSLVLPKEHGSWSFAFEPLILGLAVAPSRPGLVFALAVVAGFFIRRPLKLAVTLAPVDERCQPALRWAVLWSALALAGLGGTLQLSSWLALWPLLLAIPFGAIFLWFDLRNDMRDAEAELAGSTTFALLPATVALLAGWSSAAALGLAAIMITRSFPTVLAVRSYLRRAKGQTINPGTTLAIAGAAAVIVAILARMEIVPAFAVWFATGLFLRAIVLLTLLPPKWPAKRIGQIEAIIGVLYLAGLAWGYHHAS